MYTKSFILFHITKYLFFNKLLDTILTIQVKMIINSINKFSDKKILNV